MSLEFEVSGGEGVTHKIVAEREGENLTLTCNCPTAFSGNICAHRLVLLSGDTSMLVSDNADQVGELKEMIKGTDVDACMREIAQLDAEVREKTARLEEVKKQLAVSLND